MVPLERAIVYADRTVWADTRTSEFREVARTMHLKMVDDPVKATIDIVVDVVSPPSLVRWAVMLGGGVIDKKGQRGYLSN